MSTRLSADGGQHDIDVAMTSRELQSVPAGIVREHSIHVDLWHPGDRVVLRTRDNGIYNGMVRNVLPDDRIAVIELDPS